MSSAQTKTDAEGGHVWGGEQRQQIRNWTLIWYVFKYAEAENTQEHKQAAPKGMCLVYSNHTAPRSDLFFPLEPICSLRAALLGLSLQ